MRLCCFLTLLVPLLWATQSSAQAPLILTAKPPVYLQNEAFDGRVVLKQTGGITGRLRQYTKLETDGVVHVIQDVVVNGLVAANLDLNPITQLAVTFGRASSVRTIWTTCTLGKVFPVYLGKTFSCVHVDKQDNGRSIAIVEHFYYDEAALDASGRVVKICYTDTVNKLTARACTTPDMKWIREAFYN